MRTGASRRACATLPIRGDRRFAGPGCVDRSPLAYYSRRHSDRRCALGHRFTDDRAGADHGVRADLHAIEHLRASAEPRAVTDADPRRRAPLIEHWARRVAEVVIAADEIAVRRNQHIPP